MNPQRKPPPGFPALPQPVKPRYNYVSPGLTVKTVELGPPLVFRLLLVCGAFLPACFRNIAMARLWQSSTTSRIRILPAVPTTTPAQ